MVAANCGSIFPLSGYGNSQPIAVFDAAMLIGCFP
jgi:hypothetical protein